MKRRVFASLALLALAVTAFAQTEVHNDSVKALLHLLPENSKQQRISKEGFILPDTHLPHPQASQAMKDSITLRITTPEFTKVPWPTPRLAEGGNPWARDYNQYDAFRLTPNSYINTYSTYNTYPTMGTYIEAGAAYTHQLGDRWEVTGGMYTTKYTMPSLVHGSRFDAGFNGSLVYRINDRIRIRGVGQYSFNGEQNAANGYLTPVAPQSYYGVIMELKINEWLELHGGMERVLDPVKGKWTTVPVLYPVINIKKK